MSDKLTKLTRAFREEGRVYLNKDEDLKLCKIFIDGENSYIEAENQRMSLDWVEENINCFKIIEKK